MCARAYMHMCVCMCVQAGCSQIHEDGDHTLSSMVRIRIEFVPEEIVMGFVVLSVLRVKPPQKLASAKHMSNFPQVTLFDMSLLKFSAHGQLQILSLDVSSIKSMETMAECQTANF